MIGILETCECGRKFLRGIYPQRKCYVCDAMPPDEPKKERPIIHPLNSDKDKPQDTALYASLRR